MRFSQLQYDLPEELIAQHPVDRRDASRLLVLQRDSGECRHALFSELPGLLPPGCLLVLNDTRVIPARLVLRRSSGGVLEGLFMSEREPGCWEVMLTSSGRLRAGEELEILDSDRRLRLREHLEAGQWLAEPLPPGEALAILESCGLPPLPPYIRRPVRPRPDRRQAAEDLRRYQTVYARRPGAVAAPTAGLHFTPEILAALQAAGVAQASVTLHVGPGTFTPIRCENLADHPMHAEWYACPPETAAAVNAARQSGRAVVAVGTTSVRVLESCADESGRLIPGEGWTRLFIYPPYRFRVIDAMITNFHLPGSTLLALVFAFAGIDPVREAYRRAIQQRYRFFSYGDAMLIL